MPLALCVNPLKIAAAGLSQRAVRALGIGAAADLTEDEKQKRRAAMKRVFKDAKPYSPEVQPHVLPGLGPHPEAPHDKQLQIQVSGEKLQQVFGKIVRGCEYWLADRRIVEPPYEVAIHFVHDCDVPDVIRAFGPFGPVYLGPGFRVRRAGAHDEPLAVLYEIVLWATLKFYAAILRPEAAAGP